MLKDIFILSIGKDRPYVQAFGGEILLTRENLKPRR